MKTGSSILAAAEFEQYQGKDLIDSIGRSLYAILPGRMQTPYGGVYFRRVKKPECSLEEAGVIGASFDGRDIYLRADELATRELFEAGFVPEDNTKFPAIASMIAKRAEYVKRPEAAEPKQEPKPEVRTASEVFKATLESEPATESPKPGTPNEGFSL